ncbi:MAG: hypothetical protein AAGH76_02550 [Pseudomonadota bacterium]
MSLSLGVFIEKLEWTVFKATNKQLAVNIDRKIKNNNNFWEAGMRIQHSVIGLTAWLLLAGCQTTLHVTEKGEVMSTDNCASPFDSDWYVSYVLPANDNPPHITELFHGPSDDNENGMLFTFSGSAELTVKDADDLSSRRAKWADVAQFPCTESITQSILDNRLKVNVASNASFTPLTVNGRSERHKHFVWLVHLDIFFCKATCSGDDQYEHTQLFVGRVSEETDPPHRMLHDFWNQGISSEGEAIFREAFDQGDWEAFEKIENWFEAYPRLKTYWTENGARSHNGRIHGRGG